jgi:glutathione S-transferase
MRGPTLKLYGDVDRLSPSSLMLRVALAEADAVYEYVPVDQTKDEQRQPAFLALDPSGEIPVLVEDDFVLPGSVAILFYLAERFPEVKLIGPAPRDRARALRWCSFVATSLYPVQDDVDLHTQRAPADQRVTSLAEGGQRRLQRSLVVLEQVLSAEPHLAGDFGVADIATASVLRVAVEQLSLDLTVHPSIQDWYRRVTERPSWRAAVEG